MKYIKDTFCYLFVRGKGLRFLVFFLIALLPSVMIAYGFSIGNAFSRLVAYQPYEKWSDVWMGAFHGGLGFASIGIGLVCLFMTVALTMGALIRHFRVGDFSVKQISSTINDYVLPAAVHTFSVTVFSTFMYTVFTLFQYMWHSNLHEKAYVALSFITLFILVAAFVYVSSALTVWLPYMSVKGVLNVNAFTASFYMSRSKQKYFLPGHILIALILLATALISHYASGVWYVKWIVDSVGYAVSIVFCVCYSTIVYFGENRLPREDLNVSPYHRRYQ